MSVSVQPTLSVLWAYLKAAVVACVLVLAMGLVAHPRVYDCFRTQHKNNPPLWHGVVVCDPKPVDPPSPADVDALMACLDLAGVAYDARSLPQWTYYSADDIIPYPVPFGHVIAGYTNALRRNIFVRSDLPPEIYRRVQLHETMHALRGGGHDPFYEICAGV